MWGIRSGKTIEGSSNVIIRLALQLDHNDLNPFLTTRSKAACEPTIPYNIRAGKTCPFTPGAKARNVMNDSSTAAVAATKPRCENYYRWVEPESNITVCLEFRALDRLQLAVLRGIDSSYERNEVGGILLGRKELDEDRILIFVDEFEPVPSEHRNGPFYALTAEDALRFDAALAECSARQPVSVVGFYRSHNRDGLFLSKDDLRLIQRHFCGPDNLFLLIKTLPSRACTAGFFFWKDGRVQSEYTDSEAPLIPVSVSSAGPSLSLIETANETGETLAAQAVRARATQHDIHPESLTAVPPPISATQAATGSAIEATAKARIKPGDEPRMPTEATSCEIAPGSSGSSPPSFRVRGRSRELENRQQNHQETIRTPSAQPPSEGKFLQRWGTRWLRLDQEKSHSERRHAKRESGDGLMAFYWDGGPSRCHRVRDISLRGAYVETDFSWMCNTLITLTLQIVSKGDAGNQRSDTVAVPAKVVRTSPEGMGLEFSLSDKGNRRRLLQFLSRWNPDSPQFMLGEPWR